MTVKSKKSKNKKGSIERNVEVVIETQKIIKPKKNA